MVGVVHGEILFTDCELSLQIAGEGDWLRDANVVGKRTLKHDEIIPVLFGKASAARNCYRELRLEFQNASGRQVDVVFRCYNDAVAFRYDVPQQGGMKSIVIADEGSSFGVAANPTAYIQVLEIFARRTNTL